MTGLIKKSGPLFGRESAQMVPNIRLHLRRALERNERSAL